MNSNIGNKTHQTRKWEGGLESHVQRKKSYNLDFYQLYTEREGSRGIRFELISLAIEKRYRRTKTWNTTQ